MNAKPRALPEIGVHPHVDKETEVSLPGKIVGVLLLGFAVLFFSSGVEAQYTTGTIQGTVLDTSGAAVNQGQVTLRTKETNSFRTFTTGADGIYIFAAVPPGIYDLTAEAPNFAKASAIITATSNGNVSQNLTLPLSSQTASVTVEALAAAEFNTTDAQQATTRSELDGRDICRSPVCQLGLFMFKNFRVTESKDIQLRAESFNILNHPNFRLPDGDISSPTFQHHSGSSAAAGNPVCPEILVLIPHKREKPECHIFLCAKGSRRLSG